MHCPCVMPEQKNSDCLKDGEDTIVDCILHKMKRKAKKKTRVPMRRSKRMNIILLCRCRVCIEMNGIKQLGIKCWGVRFLLLCVLPIFCYIHSLCCVWQCFLFGFWWCSSCDDVRSSFHFECCNTYINTRPFNRLDRLFAPGMHCEWERNKVIGHRP